MAGTNSLHTNALDEVLALPSAKAAQIALRTQQVIAEETGVLNVADPLGGSWYVEALTDQLEAEAEKIFERIKDLGGDGTITSGPAARHRGRLVHRRDRRLRRSPTRSRSRRATSGSSASTRSPATSASRWRSCGSRTRSSSRSASVVAARRAARDQAAVDAAIGRGWWHAAESDREHHPADARRRPRRGHARRDLQRVQAALGRVPRAGPLLNRAVARGARQICRV